MKYNVGDKVKVRKSLVVDDMYDGISFIQPMEEYKGKVYMIEQIELGDFQIYYKLRGVPYSWTGDMLEPVSTKRNTKFEIGDKVRINADMELNKNYGGWVFVRDMGKYIGETLTICEIGQDWYKTKENSFKWTDEMLEYATKYKVGDRVRVKKDLTAGDIINGERFVSDMEKYRGEILTILKIKKDSYIVKENAWNWTDDMFEGKETEEYHIIVDGNKVIAKNYDGEYTGVAKCNLEDEFDLATGINLAIKKLQEETKKWPPIGTKYYQVRINVWGEAECSVQYEFEKNKYDCHSMKVGNFFRTHEEAEEMAKKINKLMKDNI